MMKIYTDDGRNSGLIERPKTLNIEPNDVLETIALFPNVESFQAWKKSLINDNVDMSYVFERIGGNNYSKIRDVVRG